MKTLILTVALLLPIQASAECVKKVLKEFCLGANIQTLISTKKPGYKEKINNGIFLAYEINKSRRVIIKSYKNNIAEISIFDAPGTWLKYSDLLDALSKRYGNNIDLSEYPEYATTNSSKATSISVGKGRALHKWDKGKYMIGLSWQDSKNVMISYYHTDLFTKMMNSSDDGL